MRNWVIASAAAGFTYFCLLEGVKAYSEHTNIYHNFFTDATVAGLCTYPIIFKSLRVKPD
jgi:hypothetical protein